MKIEEKIESLGLKLPEVPGKAGLFANCKLFSNNMIYVSGCGPDINGIMYKKGKLGDTILIEEGQEAARNCVLNALAILKEELGSLSRVTCIVKVLTFVSSDINFFSQPMVANGASQILIDIFGETIGCPARSAIGVSALPGNIPVEVEMLVEIRGGGSELSDRS